jgi:hypothetical protein
MPSPILAGATPLIAVDGLDYPALGQGLQRLLVTWAGAGTAACEAVFGDWGSADGSPPGFLWSDGSVLRPGVTLAVQLAKDALFGGRVLAVESRLSSSETPVFAVRAEGRAPAVNAVNIAGPIARPLRWGVELLGLDVAIEVSGPSGVTGHLRAEAIGDVARGQEALRPGQAIEILGVGAMFAGQHVLTAVSLHFDPSRGVRVQFTAQRASGA